MRILRFRVRAEKTPVLFVERAAFGQFPLYDRSKQTQIVHGPLRAAQAFRPTN